MLEALRKGAGSFLAKIFIFLLVASFAVWGVADIFRARPQTAVATVGDTEVSIDQYRQSLRQEIQDLSRRSGNYLTMDQARSLGLDSRVLGRLMAEAALGDEARERNLHVPDSVVAQSIRQDPSFQAPGGQFDQSYFQQYLRSAGYSEGAFVREQRGRLLRQAIGEAVAGTPVAPVTLAEAYHRYLNETRSAEYLTVSPAMVGEIEPADEEALRGYYSEHEAEFTAPEYRTVTLLSAQPAEIARDIEVSQEDLQAAYEARRGEFEQPERRTIQQISFDDPEAARAAYASIESGQSFEEVAQTQGISEDDLSLGQLTRDEVVDPQVADAAFSLDEGEVSEPVEGQFSTVLLRVTDIEEGSSSSLEEVAPQVREALATQRARDRILDIYDQVEDDRASGMTLQEIADNRGLVSREITVDQAGQSPDGEEVTLPQADRLLSGVFETDIGIETDPVETADDGYLWYAVTDIEPSRQLSFEEARDAVAAAMMRDRTQEAVRARTDELMQRIDGGASLQEIAQELGTEVLSVGPLKRTRQTGEFGEAALGLVFTTPEGEVAETSAADPTKRVVFRVTDVNVPDYTPEPDGPVNRQIEGALANDFLGQYISGLQEQLGSRVNQEALSVALGDTSSR